MLEFLLSPCRPGSVFVVLLLQMKLPVSVGQKKTKAIEMVLEELGLGEMAI